MLRDDNSGLEISSSIQVLEPGMYIFRYASKLPEGISICFSLQSTPLGRGVVDFFPAEGVSRNTLASLGDCIVGRVKGGQAGLLITEFRNTPDVSVKAELRIDRIDTSENLVRSAVVSDPVESTPQNICLHVGGHVQNVGDVPLQEGWLGDPNGFARIEGFCVEWPDRPQGVNLAYQCSVQGIGQLPAVLSGSYTGTRRQAAAINAVIFALIGPEAASYSLSGEAVFAGGHVCRIQDNEELSGSTGSEQLIALRLEVVPSAAVYRDSKAGTAASRPQSPWDRPEVLKTQNVDG